VADAPALVSASWLPLESGWPGMDELGAEHRRLLAARSDVSDERWQLLRGFEAEDAAHSEAMTAGFRGDADVTLPKVTPQVDRQAAVGALNARLRAANDALDGFLADAIARIEEEAPAILGDLDSRREDAAEQRREAQRLLAEAEAQEARVWRLREWVTRNAGVHERTLFRNVPGMRFVGWDLIEGFTPPVEPEPDGMGGLRPQLVNTFPGAAKHAENLNRGLTRPPLGKRRGRRVIPAATTTEEE
jgi:hypothetical protein